jgi:membrane protein
MAFKQRFKRKVMASAPMKGIIEQSKVTYIPGFGNFSLYQIWPSFIQQLKRSSLFERAAAISFNIFMAIPPTLIFVFTLIPYLPISKQFINELFELIKDIVPGKENHTVIIEFLNDFLNQPRNELLSFGLLLALFFSSNALMGILRSFDKNYEGFINTSGWEKRQTAIKLTMIVFVLVFLCIILLIAQGAVLKWLGIETVWIRNLIHNFRWIVILMLLFYSVSFIYRQGPSLVVKWPFITPGSVFATSLMVLATYLVSFWVNHFGSYNKLYGSISAVFILMSLIYINALIVLLGFELNVTITSLQIKKEKAHVVI